MRDWFKIRVISPWPIELRTGDVWFSPTHEANKADALLCNWSPAPELFTFPRRKAWYCCEPWCQFRGMEGGAWPIIRKRLAPEEFLCHNHSDPRYRVPHVTHYEELHVNSNPDRIPRAVAIVSNHGGSPWRRHSDLAYRARLVTSPNVDLFGRSGWRRYRRHWFSRPGLPTNYHGELSGDWDDASKRELMARYQVAICLENMQEPHYFTEKFVEAACAGCVPIYRAHPTVASGLLRGARWIDPSDYGDDAKAASRAAFKLDFNDLILKNEMWLKSDGLRETSHKAVFDRMAHILTAS